MTAPDLAAPSAGADTPRLSLAASSPRYGEKLISGLLFLCGALSVAITIAIVLALFGPTVAFFREVPILDFLLGSTWAPGIGEGSFGVQPIVIGTMTIMLFSLSVSLPIGLLIAIYLSEYASHRARKTIKPILEVLEGIPTVVIGLWGLWFLAPQIMDLFPFFPWRPPYSTALAGIAVGLLIIPLVASVSDDAMRAVPHSLREGAYGLGAGRMTVSLRVVFPAALSGITAAAVLAMSRAVGETMVVLLMSGAGQPDRVFNPFINMKTMTATIASTATGDIATGTTVYNAMFAVGAFLFLITLGLNIIAMRIVRRFRQEYD